jgi:transcriptional regulator with XRE-family HTH domain
LQGCLVLQKTDKINKLVNKLKLDYKAIGERIKAQRLKMEISQEFLAELDGLSVTHSSHIETGNTKVSLPALVKIANALGVTLDDLVCDSLKETKPVFADEIVEMVTDCTSVEIKIITDTIKALKKSLRHRLKE